jgi:phenylpropionate dioxygenase-like ring-hydroxylating dioxygenase large terminal subunit
LASTISRDDIIAVIGANSSSPAPASGRLFVFKLRFIGKSLPTKPAAAKREMQMEASSQIVDIVIDLRSAAANNRQIGREDTAMTISQRDRDLGTGYALRSPATRTELTSVGRGTPMGELLRRYWHPVGLVADAADIPRKVRVLGEDLILFRDKGGRVGLLHARCCHRGTTLYYGKVEDDGIRCCYHGWKFDTEGHCLEQPCEPQGGLFKDKVRQPWYPVRERYGLIFAYLGPAEKKPVLPRYDCLERMDEGEFVEADDSSIGGGGPAIIPCNWLQHFENVVDPYHVPVLHGSFSGPQFTNMMASMPDVTFEMSPRGVTVRSIRKQDEGKTFYRVTEAALPTLRVVPNPRVAQFARVESIGWTLPIDDTSFRIYVAGRVKAAGDIGRMRSRFNGKFWWDMTEPEHQQSPGDYEAQVGQGAVTVHSEEHFGQSDRGILMIRRMLSEQLDAVAAGRDPVGVSFDGDETLVEFEAGNFIREA